MRFNRFYEYRIMSIPSIEGNVNVLPLATTENVRLSHGSPLNLGIF